MRTATGPCFLTLHEHTDTIKFPPWMETNVPSLQNARVLVTGAGRFLARHTIPRLLDTGAEVIGLDVRKGLDGPNHGPNASATFRSSVISRSVLI